MELSDLTVEICDKNLQRVGVIRPEDLDFEIVPTFNGVGIWTVTLPVEHSLANTLRSPGSRLLVTDKSGDVILSGPMSEVEDAVSPNDQKGTLTVKGVSDECVLWDMLSFPEPTNPDPTSQSAAHDVRTGPVETLLHAYVRDNCGSGAPVERDRGIVNGPDLGRGPVITKRPRFPVLGALITELALAGSLGFRVFQDAGVKRFVTYALTDRSQTVRLDVRNGLIDGHRTNITAPALTHAVIAGQGEQVDRTFALVTSTDSLDAMTEWDRRIERFIDQRQTNDEAELIQAGVEALLEGGFTGKAIQIVPTTDSSMAYGTDWRVGDLVSVVVNGQELVARVTSAVIRADSSGFRMGAVLGDPSPRTIVEKINKIEARIALLEQHAETPPEDPVDPITPDGDSVGEVGDLLDSSSMSGATSKRALAPWFAALANRNAAPANMLFITDSTGDGTVSAYDKRSNRLMQDRLRRMQGIAGTSGGYGYVPSVQIGWGVAPPLTVTGTEWNGTQTGATWSKIGDMGLGNKALGISGGAKVTYTPQAADRIRVYYTKRQAYALDAQVRINGTLVTTLSSNGSGAGPGDKSGFVWESAALSGGMQTVEITGTGPAGFHFVLDAVEFLNGDKDKGVHVYDGAHYGTNTDPFVTTLADKSHWEVVKTIKPQLVVISLGINDMVATYDADHFLANIDGMLTRLRTAMGATAYSVCLCIPYAVPNRVEADPDKWSAMLTGLKDRCIGGTNGQSNVALIDINEAWPELTVDGTNNCGLMVEATNPLHPNDAGNSLIADLIVSAILPSPVPAL